MRATYVVAFIIGTAMAVVIPSMVVARDVDPDEAVVYPAEVDQSWVDGAKRFPQDSDEAVVYPVEVDQSWVDAAKRSPQDSDEAVVYPAEVDQSWVDADI